MNGAGVVPQADRHGRAAPVRVVVVDDVADLRRVVKTALERDGEFAVVGEAGDGAQAVDVVAECDPELILLDLDMPVVGGMEALPGLRSVAPDAKIVILSGLSRHTMEAPARQGGAVGFIEKGIPARRLVDELVAITGLLATVDAAIARQELSVERAPGSPRAARRFVDETLRRWDCHALVETVELLVSELVTNAVTHAGSPADVAVMLHRDAIRIEVADADPTPPELRHTTPEDISGRGLALVGTLASSWGVRPLGDAGKVVWFEVPRLDAAAAGLTIA